MVMHGSHDSAFYTPGDLPFGVNILHMQFYPQGGIRDAFGDRGQAVWKTRTLKLCVEVA